MAIGAITMILTNVGLQIYNNWCGSRQNSTLQQKREEFERAARERNTEHMWKLLREGQKLTMELEEQKHKERLEELQSELDNLLKEIAHEQTIVNWPLKVLPIVMKNQAFGNLLANQEENVAMHILFARSNYSEFNKWVHPIIEKALELHCNQHWSTKSDHPILFYSGAWDTQRCPMNPNDVQITALQTQLSNLPTLLITPFFRPRDGKLVFQVNMWGVGASKEYTFDVKEIEPKSDEFHFQHLYTNQDDYENTKGVLDWIVEDIVPYLECMIGYMADTYFWASSGITPHLPLLVTNGTINTDGMKYLVSDSREYYDQLLLTSEEKAKENPFMQENLLNLYEGSAELWDKNTKKVKLERAFLTYVNSRNGKSFSSIKDALNPCFFSKEDIPFIKTSLFQFADSDYEAKLISIKKVLDTVNFDYSILESTDIETLKQESEDGNSVASYRLGEIYEYSIGVKWNESLSNHYYQVAQQAEFVLAELNQDIDLYEEYCNEVECLYNAGVSQSIVVKVKWLCSQNRKNDALALVKMTNLSHPAILFKKAEILIDANGDTFSIEDLLTTLASQGYVKAQELLCDLYQKGGMLPENPSKHAEYAEKAMLQKSPKGTYQMALCYLKGYGVQKSPKTSLLLIDKAVELGYAEAIRIKSLYNQI